MASKTAKDFRETIDMVIAPKLAVVEETRPSELREVGVFGVFVNEKGNIVGGLAADYNLANFLGSAMTRIPAPGAKDNAQNEEITDMILENLAEIFNVCTKLFNRPKYENVMLENVKEKDGTWESYPSGFEQATDGPRRQKRITFDVDGYGSGELDIYMK